MTVSKLKELGATALRASSVAGLWAVGFGVVFFFLMFVAILGFVPGSADLVGATLKLLGMQSTGRLDAVAVFWALLVYVAILSGYWVRVAPEGEARVQGHHVVFGTLAVLAFCAGIAFLVAQRGTEAGLQSAKELAVEFVRRNETIMSQFGPKAYVYVSSYSVSRDQSVSYYDVSIGELTPSGDYRFLDAIVHVSTDGPAPQAKLLCTTTTPLGKRDPYKHPCEQQ